MKKYLRTISFSGLQDIKNTEIFLVYYIIPLVFFVVMGTIFSSIIPNYNEIILPSMTIFTITMGAILGIPISIYPIVQPSIRSSFIASGIPLSSLIISRIISSFLHLNITCIIIQVFSPLLFKADIPNLIGRHILIYMVGMIASIAIGVVIGLSATSSSKLTLYAQCVFLPSILLSGIMFSNELLPSILQTVGYLFPASHMMNAMFEGLTMNHLVYVIGFSFVIIITISIRIKQLNTSE